jgi:hypothetical protein
LPVSSKDPQPVGVLVEEAGSSVPVDDGKVLEVNPVVVGTGGAGVLQEPRALHNLAARVLA